MNAPFSSKDHADAELVATRIAESACRGKNKDGSPKAPTRYTIIYQSAYAAVLAFIAISRDDK